MITEKGEQVLRTGRIDNRKALPEEILILELNKRHPDVGNLQEIVVNLIMEYGTAEDALEALNEGDCEIVPKTLH